MGFEASSGIQNLCRRLETPPSDDPEKLAMLRDRLAHLINVEAWAQVERDRSASDLAA